jgi:hypothetical protein
MLSCDGVFCHAKISNFFEAQHGRFKDVRSCCTFQSFSVKTSKGFSLPSGLDFRFWFSIQQKKPSVICDAGLSNQLIN